MTTKQYLVTVVNTGKAKDAQLQMCLRWLCYLLTKYDSLVKLQYIETANNKTADLLSRSVLSVKDKVQCDGMIEHCDLVEDEVDPVFWKQTHDW